MLGEILGVIGILVSVFLALRGVKEKKPFYCTTTRTVFDTSTLVNPPGSVPRLTVRCGDNEITALYVTEILFWNGGREMLTHADLHQGESDTQYHLRIQADDGAQIFGEPMSGASGINNKFRCDNNTDGTIARLSFHHLAYGDGFIVSVTHTGRIQLAGTLIGLEPQYRDESPARRVLVPWILAYLALFAVAAFLDHSRIRPDDTWLAVGSAVVFFAVFLALWANMDPLPTAFRRFVRRQRAAVS